MEGCSFQARVDFQINREVLEKVMEHKHAKHPSIIQQLTEKLVRKEKTSLIHNIKAAVIITTQPRIY